LNFYMGEYMPDGKLLNATMEKDDNGVPYELERDPYIYC